MTDPLDRDFQPDISAPLNMSLDASGNIVPVRVPTVTGVPTGINDVVVGSGGGQAVLPNSGGFFPAADFTRGIFFTYQSLVYAPGGAGFSVQGEVFLSSGTGHPVFNAPGFVKYIPAAVSDQLQISINGHAYCSTVNAGEVPEFEIVVRNNGTVNLVADGAHSAWWGVAVPI